MTATPSNFVDAEYDIIFAGGGPAACLTAGRLAAADPTMKILILEAGPHTRDLPEHVQPALFLGHLQPTSKTVKFTVAHPSEHVAGRAVIVQSARCVGGGSSINFMMYTRAAASDYDDWETVHENSGWGSKDLIPLLKKTETYQIQPGQHSHGYDGPLKVSYGGVYTNVGKMFLEMAAEYDKERRYTEDLVDMHTVNVFGRWPKWIDSNSGRRSDVPHHFIYNQASNKNLHVAAGCTVKRVIIENERAVGIEFLAVDEEGSRIVRAKRLVVVAAGALGSPSILERSGIGAKTVLEAAGVEQVVDLPGVGENYNDHLDMFVPYLARDDAETYDSLFSGDLAEYERSTKQWQDDGTGYIGSTGIDAGVKVRPSPKDLETIGPDFTERWSSYYLNPSATDKALFWTGCIAGFYGDHSGLPARKYFTSAYFLNYPESTGHIHITSSDINSAPDFDPRFLRSSADLACMRWAYKLSREYARRHPLYKGEMTGGFGHPTFPEGSAAAVKETEGPVPIAAPDLEYSAADDEAIDRYLRKRVETTWHSLGTCAMKPRGRGGVVDSRLNVYGIKNLKVADISIAPSNVGANTYSTALTIGEKAALLIAEDLGIAGV